MLRSGHGRLLHRCDGRPNFEGEAAQLEGVCHCYRTSGEQDVVELAEVFQEAGEIAVCLEGRSGCLQQKGRAAGRRWRGSQW